MSTSDASLSLVSEVLLRQYGPFMDSDAICKVLYFPTRGALQAAKARGQLPFKPVKLDGRPGIFALTSDIAALASRLAEHGHPEKENNTQRTT